MKAYRISENTLPGILKNTRWAIAGTRIDRGALCPFGRP
jgi:hypothetical protein